MFTVMFVCCQVSSYVYSDVCLFMIVPVSTYICYEYCYVGKIKPQVFGIPVFLNK